MDPVLKSNLLKLALPLGGVAAVLLVTRLRGIPRREGLGLRWPRARLAVTWIAGWIGWMVLGELVIAQLGLPQPAPWPAYTPLVFAIRVAAIGLVGPLSEELIARGLAFHLLSRTRLRVAGAVVVTAAAWALLHVRYDAATIALIFVDGLVLGAARAQSGSVLLPWMMHALGNLYSIWQSTHG